MGASPYYRNVVTCTAGCPVVQNCNVDRSLSSRWLPRKTTSRCEPGEVLDRVVITNAVRCTTPRNFGEYGPEVRSEIGAECVKRHLVAEIDYRKPKLIVAAGKPVREMFTDLVSRGLLDVDFVTTRHPHALGRFIRERKDQFGEMLRTGTAS
ncbi:MAG: hypothetical protein P8R42_04770 [Candidatus Binatia bacterium]|nr:hypothetical protein [Candidatus Binatia bacterium]